MGFIVGVSSSDECSGKQAEDADKVHGREATSGLLALALRPFCLVCGRVGHGKPGAVHQSNVASMPESVVGNVALHTLNEVGIDFVHDLDGNSLTCLAIRDSVLARGMVFFMRESAAGEGHDFANGLPAGGSGGLHLIEKTPENDVKSEDALATVGAECRACQELLWDVGGEDATELGKGAAFRECRESFI